MNFGLETGFGKDKEEEFYDPVELPHFTVEYSKSGLKDIVSEIRKKNYDDWQWFKLALQADSLSLTQGFSELLALEHLSSRWKQVGVVPYPHQIKTAEKVLKEL